MIFTARQLEDLHRTNGNGQLVLPYGARLTPLATDWIRTRKIDVGYGPDEIFKTNSNKVNLIPEAKPTKPQAEAPRAGSFLWWCDGPCGAAKASVGALAKESNVSPIDTPPDPRLLVTVIKQLAAAVKSANAAGGILMLQSGGAAVVLANRCPSLRAVLGTTFESLEAAVAAVAANVLVLEYPRKSFSEIRNLLSRFVGAPRDLRDDVRRQLQELASCG
jgi:ribose 5-phosphate isomerase RpiB